jgi:UDP-glucose 4-epimerase
LSDRVLVTGGAGFIGSHVCEQLRAKGRAVTVLDDLSTGFASNLEGLDVELVRGSVLDESALHTAMRGVNKIVHLAALPSVARSVEEPLATHHACATGTLMVLRAARAAGARVVYGASSSAYGDQASKQKHEGLREDPLSPYAAAKFAGELYCRSFARVYGMSIVVTRFFNVFGPRQSANNAYAGVVAAFCRALLCSEPPRINGDGLQSRDFTYVEDVVAGVLQCLDGTSTGCETVNLAYGQACTVRELYEQLAAAARQRLPSVQIAPPVHVPPRVGDVRHSLADTTRARQLFGFDPRIGFREGLLRTFDWYRGRTRKQ